MSFTECDVSERLVIMQDGCISRDCINRLSFDGEVGDEHDSVHM